MANRIGWLMVGLLALTLPGWAVDDVSEARMRKDVTYLASDECEGRGVATQGINKAADYIAAEFKKAGLKPGVGDSYFQPFTIPGGTLEATPVLVFRDPNGKEFALEAGKQFDALGLGFAGKLERVPVVFAGYGVTDPSGYDDYDSINAAGKLVIVLRGIPRPDAKENGLKGNRRELRSFTSKLLNAEKHKAAGVVFVTDRATATETDPATKKSTFHDEVLPFNYTAPFPAPAKLPAAHALRSVIDELLRAANRTTLDEIEEKTEAKFEPPSFEWKGWTASLEVKMSRKINVKNVVGVLEGAGPLADETVVVGAHYDHLGLGGPFSTTRSNRPATHYGADDNGSGTTVMLELARRNAAIKDRQGRRLVFIAFTGEELNLLGSDYYVKNPVAPLADTVAMINLDMVGRLRPHPKTKKDHLEIEGTGTAKGFEALLDTLNQKYDFELKRKPSGRGPSDHTSFYEKKVPVLFMFTGDHPEYHKPSDTAERINVAGMNKVANWTQEIVTELTTSSKRPEYVEQKLSAGGIGPGGIPKIGIRPDYTEDEEGVLLKDVTEGGPAAKAGMKGGDRIVELNGKRVTNMATYMELISKGKPGTPIEITVMRDGKKVPLKVTPE